MPRPSLRGASPRLRFALAAAAAQTLIAAFAAASWLQHGTGAAAVVLFASWAALGLAVMVGSGGVDTVASVSSASVGPIGEQKAPEEDPETAWIVKRTALLPLCQIAVGAVVCGAAAVPFGFTVAEGVAIAGGVGGAFGTLAMIAVGAYLSVLCGVLAALIVAVPALMLWRLAGRRGANRGPIAAMALMIPLVFLLAVGATLGVGEPSGVNPKSTTLPVLLTLFGVDLADRGYPVESPAWLWTARIAGLALVAAGVAVFRSGRSRRRRH
ncbi:hypothetical protein [Glycomyces paridis]|uniref:Uncharacterized protein n=1 Tax=Glycomyces paridis TaxID=2126555 RepID=A0A4S8PCD5_9ACTN|nr:hypothetical protein [Glycomyces paridis]THV26812.1 hypothetical protein E9998_17660 [Glycomyces paridis]